MELDILVCEIDIHDVLNRSVDVRQVFDVSAVLQQSGLATEARSLDHLHLRVERLRGIVDIVRITVTKDDNLVVLRHLDEERSQAGSLEHLGADTQVVRPVHQGAVEADYERLRVLHARDLVRQHLRHGRLGHEHAHVINEPVETPGGR